MTTRRDFVAGVAGTATTVGLAGCLGSFTGGEDDGDGETPGETDDELLRSVANPSGQVQPLFFAGYRYEIQSLEEELALADTIPRLGGSLAGLIDEQIDGFSLADVEYITGAIFNSAASSGDLQFEPLPSGQAVHATGAFDRDTIVDWIEDNDTHSSIGESEGYERYAAEIQGGQGFEALAIGDDVFIVANRSDVTNRNPDYESYEEAAEDALANEISQRENDETPIVDVAPAFAKTVESLDLGSIRAGTGYALVPLGSDIGTESHDEVVRGVVAAGLSTDLENLQRSITYLEEGMGSPETLERAFEDSEIDELPVDSWEFESDEETVIARTTLDETPTRDMLETALPVAGYESLFRRVNPESLGREPTPRVFFQPSIDDGTLRIEHVGGTELEDLRVRYVNNGEVQRETWEGPVSEGDQFTSAETIDSGTQAWLTWRPETVDAAVLTRFETPE